MQSPLLIYPLGIECLNKNTTGKRKLPKREDSDRKNGTFRPSPSHLHYNIDIIVLFPPIASKRLPTDCEWCDSTHVNGKSLCNILSPPLVPRFHYPHLPTPNQHDPEATQSYAHPAHQSVSCGQTIWVNIWLTIISSRTDPWWQTLSPGWCCYCCCCFGILIQQAFRLTFRDRLKHQMGISILPLRGAVGDVLIPFTFTPKVVDWEQAWLWCVLVDAGGSPLCCVGCPDVVLVL